MAKKWYPVINYDTCIACGVCFGKCQHGVYELEGRKPVIVNPDGCIDGCRGCQLLCPSESIQYVGDTGNKKSGGCSCGCTNC